MQEKNDYMKRQLDILSNLGMFYLIIIGLFAIPLCAAFVVVIINGVMDLKHLIMGIAIPAMIIIFLLAVRFARKLFLRLRSDGMSTYNDAARSMNRGEPVQISLLNGLVTFSYGRDRHAGALPYHAGPDNPLLLPEQPSASLPQSVDIVSGLKDLAELKDQGIIDEAEFKTLKARLITEPEDKPPPALPDSPTHDNEME